MVPKSGGSSDAVIAGYNRPSKGFKEVEDGAVEKANDYVQTMFHAYTTSHYLAVDLEKEVPLFIDKARQRIKTLIYIIARLRKELYDAKIEVIKVNQRLHEILRRGFQDDPSLWDKDLEIKIMNATGDELAINISATSTTAGSS